MRTLIIIVVILAAAAAGVWYWASHSTKKAVPAAPATAKVERGVLCLTVASTGRVVSNLDVDIKCKASGEVVRLPFDVSDPVRKDALLVELDPVDEERVLKQTGVELSSAEARLVVAKQDLDIAVRTLATDRKRADAAVKAADAKTKDARLKADRKKQLLEKAIGTQDDYDTAQTTAVQAEVDLEVARIHQEEMKTEELGIELKRQELAIAESAVESDKIALSIAQDRRDDTKVLAPIDGIVAQRDVQIGQIISSGISNVGGGTTVLTLSDLSRIFVLAAVDESDIGRVQVGQPAVIKADAFPDQTFEGKIVRIATRGVNASNVVTFEVKIEVVGEKKSLLKPEMTANVEITTMEKPNVLLVPVEAVSRKGAKASVTVSKGDSATEIRDVTLGMTDGLKVEVDSGLSEGETVVYTKSGPESRFNAAQSAPRGPGPPPF
jgi:HlyD family secretion protein